MANLSLIDQLDQALDGIIADPLATRPGIDAEVEPLLRLAIDLRDLPRPQFRAQLKARLAGESTAATRTEIPPVAFRATATTYLCVRNAAAALEFYKNAFGATELMRLSGPGEKISHACIVIGGASIMLADELPEAGFLSPQSLGGSPVKIHLDVTDVDGLAARALAAGAEEVRPVQDQFYGARSGQFADPFGYTWILSMRTEEVTPAEMQRRLDAMLKPEDKTAVSNTNIIRAGFRTVTPYLVVPNVHEEIAFIRQVFAGEGEIHGLGSAGGFHSECKIGDSMLMIGGGGEDSTWQGTPVPATIHIYVDDVDAVYEQAVQAGATDLHPPQDQVYGERSAAFRDVGGNQWYPATYKGAQHIPEGLHSLMPYLHPRGAARQMEFLKDAFGAEEVSRGETPEGVIYHAQVRIGSSIIEMGEAHDEWQPRPAQFMLYVDDVDTWFARAVQTEGAVSLSLPANQPYGAKVGAVKDPFDNTWYLATPTRDS
jgi:PhnB protein